MSAANDMKGLLAAIADFFPRLVGAALVLLAALLVALLLQRLSARALQGIGLDRLFESTGASDVLWRLGYSHGPSRLLGVVVFWGAILTGIASALNVLGLSSLETTMSQIANFSGRALLALVLLTIGTMAAGWLSDLVARESERAGLRGSNAFRRVVFIAVISVAVLLAASQLGLDTSLVIALAVVILGAIGLAAALAVGQGLILLSGNVAASRYVQDSMEEGDVISVNDIEGTVEEIGHTSVAVRSEDGDLYRIPNRTFLENIVRKKA